jgi:hypothetical protein
MELEFKGQPALAGRLGFRFHSDCGFLELPFGSERAFEQFARGRCTRRDFPRLLTSPVFEFFQDRRTKPHLNGCLGHLFVVRHLQTSLHKLCSENAESSSWAELKL